MKVLFVCTGNICRSPVAERMLQDRSDALGLGLTVSSAGTRARNGHPIHEESRRVLHQRGLDADDFTSRLLTERIAAEQGLVLCLTRDHRSIARQLVPARWKRMVTLREAQNGLLAAAESAQRLNPNDPALDIVDPIGRSAAVFDTVSAEIEEAVDALTWWFRQGDTTMDAMPWLS